MSYYFTLAFKYIKHNKARTLYSILGITLTFVLCFCMLTMGFSAWDYSFYMDYKANPYELFCFPRNEDNQARNPLHISYLPPSFIYLLLFFHIFDLFSKTAAASKVSSSMSLNLSLLHLSDWQIFFYPTDNAG